MASFDLGAGINSVVSTLKNSSIGSNLGNLGSSLGQGGKLAGVLNNLQDPTKLLSGLRSLNLPVGGNTASPGGNIGAAWGGNEAEKDWRVKLSIPNIGVFQSSSILQPVISAGAMVFPYTPSIKISHTANYDEQSITHQNYQFITYQNSKVDKINISAPFYVEDAVQAQYWLAAVHYFRSVSKMFTGSDAGSNAGSPPPIVYLSGYGDFVFKNIPVVVTSFSVDLSSDTNYISTSLRASIPKPAGPTAAAPVSQANGWMSLASAALQTAGLQNIAGMVTGLSSKNSQGSFQQRVQIQAMQGDSHVPVKSTFEVGLQPIYSRQTIRQFSLQDFVKGAYVDNKVGYN
jgi:hypothetical protein